MDTQGTDTRVTKPIPTVGDKEKQQPENPELVNPEVFFAPKELDYIKRQTTELEPEEREAVLSLIHNLNSGTFIEAANIMSLVSRFGVVNQTRAMELYSVAKDIRIRLKTPQLQ